MERKLKKPTELFRNIYSREAPIQSLDMEKRIVKGVLATELPVVVADWFNWRMIREIVLIDGLEIPERMPLLDSHSRFEVADIKGSVVNPEKTNDPNLGRIALVDYEFSSTAEREFTLVIERHLTSTSFGYEVYPDQSVELKYGEQREVAGKLYKNDYPDKLPLVIRLKARAFEGSLVPIGADQAAKFRSMFQDPPAEPPAGVEAKEESKVNEKTTIIINKGVSKMEEKNQEQMRVDAIKKLAETFRGKVNGVNLDETADLFIHGNKSEREFADFIFERQKASASFGKPTIGLSEKESSTYSIIRAINSLINGDKCVEREISEEYARRQKINMEGRGIILPYEAFLPKMRRDLTAGGVGLGKELVGTDHLGDMFIDYLYSKLVLDNVFLMPNSKGNIAIPVQTGTIGYGWAAETADVSEGTPSTSSKTASPKKGGAFVDLSRQLLVQSNPYAESLAVKDLVQNLKLGLQNAILYGDGLGDNPVGLKNTSGLPSAINLATPNWQKFVEFESVIDDNFGDDRNMYFVTRRSHRGKLKSTPKEVGQAIYICGSDNRVNGYEMRTTNTIQAGDVFFGDWTNIIVPMWDAIEITIDPYTQRTKGVVRIVADQLLDVIVRYPQAFAYGNGFVD